MNSCLDDEDMNQILIWKQCSASSAISYKNQMLD